MYECTMTCLLENRDGNIISSVSSDNYSTIQSQVEIRYTVSNHVWMCFWSLGFGT
jgi:hypothetical protein